MPPRPSGGAKHSQDSLFGLPLFPPPSRSKGRGVDPASRRLTACTNQRLAAFSPTKARRQLSEVSEEEWRERGQRRALTLFHAAGEQRSYPGSS